MNLSICQNRDNPIAIGIVQDCKRLSKITHIYEQFTHFFSNGNIYFWKRLNKIETLLKKLSKLVHKICVILLKILSHFGCIIKALHVNHSVNFALVNSTFWRICKKCLWKRIRCLALLTSFESKYSGIIFTVQRSLESRHEVGVYIVWIWYCALIPHNRKTNHKWEGSILQAVSDEVNQDFSLVHYKTRWQKIIPWHDRQKLPATACASQFYRPQSQPESQFCIS